MTDTAQRSFPQRLASALCFDPSVYEEVEADRGALGQAAVVVGLAGLARGIGAVAEEGTGALVGSIAAGMAFWLVVTTAIWAIGVRALGHTSDYPELLRTLGFAAAPLTGLVVLALPLGAVGWLVSIALHGLGVYAMVIAVRCALDVPAERAAWVCLIAAILGFLILALLGALCAVPPAAAR